MQSCSSSSFNRPNVMKYDVFISFRGKDVRYTFAGHLYDALNRLGIKAFMDDKRFKIGDHLDDLFQIIEESRCAIIVLSEDYASAKWCLRELTKIMDSMGTTMMDRVLPVFYHVDPSIVKDQSGPYKKSFEEHEANALKETNNQEKEKRLNDLQNWRKALKKIGNHTGVLITKNSSEVEVVKKIAQQIFDARRPKLEAFNKNLVGMKSRLLQMNMRLGLGLDDVRFIAIVGMGGIGKTTIAQVIFDCLISMFDDCCFLTLSGGDSKQSIVSLQREMLSQIFHTESFRILHENHGLEMIKNQLSGRKVLIVLDGIEEKMQLEMLVGSIKWFGHGSRVIITTRNKELLYHRHNVEMKEYNVEELDRESALQLFLQHAFDIKHENKDGFMDLMNEIVEKVKRLPLALRVIGSFLYRKEIGIWRETLKSLIKVEEKSFFDVLKISYDGLGVESQQVFLDLTCFFNGKSEDRVIEILESFGYSPKSEIQLLMQRCLIEVSRKKILVHDLILEMGREIVHKESLTQLGKQSRIWLHEDLYRSFTQKYGLKYIQGIVLCLEKETKESIQLDAKSFSKMTSLRIIEMNNVELFGDIEYLSQLLRLINWFGYPSKCLPPTFQSRYLFELHLPNSHMLHLWDGKRDFEKLKVIDVSNSEHLRMTPDFSGVPNLERLVLRNCVRLCEIHPSINCLNYLILLDLNGCSDLKLFPPNTRCKNLQIWDLDGTSLETSLEIGENMERLAHLHLGRSKITQLHPSIGHLSGLVLLDLSYCLSLSSLPSEIGNLRSLKTLLLRHCTKLDQIPPNLANAESLETLCIMKTSITHIPSSMHCLKKLKTLECTGLSCGIWKSLVPQFNIHHQIVSTGLGSLKTLNLSDCKLVDEDVPQDLHCFSSLETLDLSYNNFTTLPNSLSHLKKLKLLLLNCCTELKDLPKLPKSLEHVQGVECRSISKQFYNKRVHVSSSPEHQLHLDFPIRSKTAEVECTMNPFQHSMLDRRPCEEGILEGRPFYIMYALDVDILKWFDQINEGNWIDIQYNQEEWWINSDISNDVCGFFLSASIEYQQTLDGAEFGTLSVRIKIDGKVVGDVSFLVEFKFSTTRNIWVSYIPVTLFKDGLMAQSSCSIKAEIICGANIEAKVKVKSCGASSILSWKNVSEYLATFFTKRYCSQHKFHNEIVESNQWSEWRCDELEVAEDDFESEDSTYLLRKNSSLKPILRRIFEEQKLYFEQYFFPQTKISGDWFRNQNKNDKVAVKLPLNIHKENRWMGLAMFAVFSISEKANCRCFNYLIQSNGKTVSSRKSSIPMTFLEYSNQILVILFIPQNYWDLDELNSSSSNHVYITFKTNVERMQVELCGARPVYNQNVDGLIQTIVNCMVESGDELCEYYSKQIVQNHLHVINSHSHYKVPSSQNTSLKNQTPTTALTTTDSSFSVEQLLHGSFPHPLFHKTIQERFRTKFDLILHGDKIPELFTNQSTGNIEGIRLPQSLKKCVGLAVCALVVVDKQTGKLKGDIRERERYTKVVDLIYKFRVDSSDICPVHYHYVSQEKLLTQYESRFIWLSYIPLTEFYISLHNCNHLEMTLGTSCDELFRVQHCGLHLINAEERKEIDKMIMESTVLPSITNEGKESQR